MSAQKHLQRDSRRIGRFDSALSKARNRIQTAIVEHCAGADLASAAADAAHEILGEILFEAQHEHPDGTFACWKRMPPKLRAAIAKATSGEAV